MLPNYSLDPNGVLCQMEGTPIPYDRAYVEERYDTYGELNERMAHLRLGYITGVLGQVPTSLLDVGYGNGAFLKTASRIVPKCYGFDISGYPIPDGCTFVEDWKNTRADVVTFFDVLEHFPNPYILRDLRTDFVVLSVPWCHYYTLEQTVPGSGDVWFEHWKHRRPNEHLWFFDPRRMAMFAKANGFEQMHACNLEDTIRKDPHGAPNIMTVTLRRI